MTDNIAKAIMKEVKNAQKAQVAPEKTSLLLFGCIVSNWSLVSAKEVKEKIESSKVEDALKRPSAVLDAETKKILHSFLQGDYCLRWGSVIYKGFLFLVEFPQMSKFWTFYWLYKTYQFRCIYSEVASFDNQF